MGKPRAAGSEKKFDPRVSLTLERVLVKYDYAVLRSLSPVELREGLNKLEEMIQEEGATSYLDELCAAGCDRRELLWLLHPLSSESIFKDARWSNKAGPGSIKALLGITPKKLNRLLKKLNDVVKQLDIVNEQVEFSALLMMSKQLYPISRLPRNLRTCASVLHYAAKHFAGNAHIYDNIAKARLTSYVLARIESAYVVPRRRRYREFHDEEIAALISAVSSDKDCRYGGIDHRVWRGKHYRRLSMLDPQLDQGPFAGSSSTSQPESKIPPQSCDQQGHSGS